MNAVAIDNLPAALVMRRNRVPAGTDLRAMALEAMGCTEDDLRAAYCRGRKTQEQYDLRARLDARFLELHRAGANMALLGEALGFPRLTNNGGMSRTVDRALDRAREAESAPAVLSLSAEEIALVLAFRACREGAHQ